MWSSPLEVKSNNLLLGRDLTIYAWNANILPFRINSLPTISALKFNGALTMAVGTSTGQVNMFQLETSLLSYCFRGVYITGNTHSSVHCLTRLWGITVWPAWRGYSDCRVLSGPWETLLLAPMVGLRDSQAEAAVELCLMCPLDCGLEQCFLERVEQSSVEKQKFEILQIPIFEVYSAFKYTVEALRIPVDKKCAESVFPKGICPRSLFFPTQHCLPHPVQGVVSGTCLSECWLVWGVWMK